MQLYEKTLTVPLCSQEKDLLAYFAEHVSQKLDAHEVPVRFAVTRTDDTGFHCEVGVIAREHEYAYEVSPLFSYTTRAHENTDTFNAVLIIPTGVGAEIGGHCGDGNATARLLAQACDTLITHPNVVNASDINELPENGLYVEGSIITRLLLGKIGLQRVRANRLLMLMDTHADPLFTDEVINAVSSARATLGLSCDVYEMKDVIDSVSTYAQSGRCVGTVSRMERLLAVIEQYTDTYDAFGLSTVIDVPDTYHEAYFSRADMINPWGGVEALLTHTISEIFDVPSAHAPMINSQEVLDIKPGVVDPRKAPETASMTYLHCVLKGLHTSPRVTTPDHGLTVADVSCVVMPAGCLGMPTLAALAQDIPVIVVAENTTIMKNDFSYLPYGHDNIITVSTYLEAAGVMNALQAGVSIDTLRRPLAKTTVFAAE